MSHRDAVLERLEDRLLLSVTAEEQLFVYLLNRARHNPQAYQLEANLVVDLSGVAARPPLAISEQLSASARFHAEEMAEFDYFAHQSPVTGAWPNQLARDAGYALPAGWANNDNFIESLGGGQRTAAELLKAFIEDIGVPDLGHRIHLLGMGDFHSQNREIGVGYASRPLSGEVPYRDFWSVHATFSNPADRFLTGVVFVDLNHNGRYDLNEGLAGVTITAGGFTTSTNQQGGWSIKVPDGQYTVMASGGGFADSSELNVNVNGASVAVDFASTLPGGWINFARVGAQPPAIISSNQAIIEGDSGTQQMVFTVSLANASPEAWDVYYGTFDGTATAGSDYLPVSGVLSFPPGETTRTIAVEIVGDTLFEDDEIFLLGLTGPVNSLVVTGTILNDDQPVPIHNIFILDAATWEGQAGVTLLEVAVMLSQASDQPISVNYTTVDGTAIAGLDYVYQAGTVYFAPGQTTASITMAILGDTVFEPNEAFYIQLSDAVNGTLLLPYSTATVTILNDDAPLLPAVVVTVGIKKRTLLANGQNKATSFGTVALGSRPPVQKFWIYNKGNAPMNIGRIRLPKGFALASPQPKVVTPGKVATILVTMNTRTAARYSGAITFATTDPSNRSYRINVIGTVVAAPTAARATAASPAAARPFSALAVRDPAIEQMLA
jgi:hypothetical protein